MSHLIVTGMVRSGTTVISRAIDAHPAIVCAPDPCLGVLRPFNNALRRRTYGDVDPNAPLTDFFFSGPEDPGLYAKARMDLRLEESLDALRAQITRFAEHNSPGILPLLPSLRGTTYAEVLRSLVSIVGRAYGSAGTRCVGFKQAWAEALVPAMLGSLQPGACVHIVRDPRAVIASWMKSEYLSHDYSFLMMIRHWRKSVGLASLWSQHHENYVVVRHEDFATRPEAVLKAVASATGVPYSDAMLDGSSYRSGAGASWHSNTSYGTGASHVSAALLERWRNRLSPSQVALVEELCRPEMEWLDLPMDFPEADLGNLLGFDAPVREAQFVDSAHAGRKTYALTPQNRALEVGRWLTVQNQVNGTEIPAETLQPYLIDPSILKPRERAFVGQ